MKYLFLLSCVVLGLSGCGKPPAAGPVEPRTPRVPSSYVYVTPDEAEKLIASTPDLGILDVRDEPEMHAAAGMINHARPCSYFGGNLPILQGLDRKAPWLVYCAIGGRADFTAEAMGGLGFEKVYLLKGGFNAWVAAKKPTAKGF